MIAGEFELADRLTTVRAKLDTKSTELAKPETPAAEVMKWDGQVTLQALALQRANFGLDAVRERLDGMTKGMGTLPPKFANLNLPEYVKQALMKVAVAFVDGTALCELPATADAKLTEAERLAVFVSLDLLDGLLTQVVQILRDEARSGHTGDDGAHPAYEAPDSDAMAKREIALRKELAAVRTQILTDPTAAGSALKALSEKIQDLSSGAEIVGNMDELDRLWTAIDKAALGLNGPALDQSSAEAAAKAAWERGAKLRARCDALVTRWRSAYALWKKGAETARRRSSMGSSTIPSWPRSSAIATPCSRTPPTWRW